MGSVTVQRHVQAFIPKEKHSELIVLEAGWAPGQVRPGAEDVSSPNGIWSPDIPARSEMQNRLSYSAPTVLIYIWFDVWVQDTGI